jgi:CheY-like chemotaxis protein/AraC-like DNA-binding protein
MGSGATGRAQILVVDDDRGIRDALRLLLEEDYDVEEACNGSEALALTATRAFDLIVLDVRMPGMSGFDVLTRVREITPTTKVILLSAVDEARPAALALKCGAVDYLTKPFLEDELLQVIRHAIGARPVASTVSPHVAIRGNDAGWRSSLAALLRARVSDGILATSLDRPRASHGMRIVVIDVMNQSARAIETLALDALRMNSAQVILWGSEDSQPPSRRAAKAVLFRGRRTIDELAHYVGNDLSIPGPFRAFTPATMKAVQVFAHAYTTATVEDVAGAAHISSRHLARLFHDDTGMTLKTFLQRVRVEAAKTLLRESSEKLEVIAQRVGLYDASHLHRVFDQLEGISPRAYRMRTHTPPMSQMS